MNSLFDTIEFAACSIELDMRAYTSRLLGKDKSLVVHGGGNTSVKLTDINAFGEQQEMLYVKGGGWDLETIQVAGFSPVRLQHLQRLATLPSLPDPAMVNEMVTAGIEFIGGPGDRPGVQLQAPLLRR